MISSRFIYANPLLGKGRNAMMMRWGKTTLSFTRSSTHRAGMSSFPSFSSTFTRIQSQTNKVYSPHCRMSSNQTKKAVENVVNVSKSKVGETSATTANTTTFLQRWTAHKEIPPRGTLKWYGEMVLICTVFAITGTSTMVLVRPAVSEGLGLRGSLKDGPWSYRICSLVIMTPLYSAMLVLVGTVFGRHFYFRHFAVKMFSRFGIPPELMDKSFHETAKHFRKY